MTGYRIGLACVALLVATTAVAQPTIEKNVIYGI